MNINIGEIIKKAVLIAIVLALSNIIASFFFGIILTLGGNIESIGLSKPTFDPLITIAYILVYYFTTIFYQPSPKAQYFLFLFVLWLSFTVNFIQGSVSLVIMYSLLKRFKVI